MFYEGILYTSVEIVGLSSVLLNEDFRPPQLAGFEGVRALFGLKILQMTFVVDISLLLGDTDWLWQLYKIHCKAMGEYLLTQHLCPT